MNLDVYLYGDRIGELWPVPASGGYQFAYSREALAGYEPGAALLSTSLPVREEPYSPDATRAYVEGMLPRGTRRRKLARELGVDPADGYALVARLGRDCAGGAVFVPAGEPPLEGGPPDLATEEELEELVASPPCRLFDPERPQRMRSLLPGLRHKISLTRAEPGGRWAWPRVDMPSTHIVKPESGEYPEMVANEMFCTSVLAATGLPVTYTTIASVGGRRCLVTERFDRVGERPRVQRVHQESFCQALSFAPDPEPGSEEADGPGFAEACGLLRAVGQEGRVRKLLAAALASYVLGNGDAHGDNFALLVIPSGSLFAPFYDVVSTAVYDDPTHVGMTIAEDYDDSAYLPELALVCERAGIDFDHGRAVAASLSAQMLTAIELVAERARQEGWHVPIVDAIAELAGERALNLGYEVQC